MDFFMSKVKNWKSKFNGSFMNSLNNFIPKDINFDETYLDPYYEIVIWNHSVDQISYNKVSRLKDYFSNFGNRSGKPSLMHEHKETSRHEDNLNLNHATNKYKSAGPEAENYVKQLLMNYREGENYILKKYGDPCYEIKDLGNGTELVTINVSAVTDYYTYKHFHDSITNDPEKTIKDVESYMSEIFQRIDAYYGAIDSNKHRYTIRLTELMILNDPKDSWLKVPDYRSFEYYDYLLGMFRIFMNFDKKHDAVLAFTKYKDQKALGLSIQGSIGQSMSFGVVLLNDVLTTSSVAAHELGHILGTDHDECDLGDYESIMKSPKTGDRQKLKFSNKSIQEMSRTIEYLKDRRKLLNGEMDEGGNL